MNELQPPDSHHLSAAQGWLELGNHLEANQELEEITPQVRAHPDVLEIRWQIHAKEERWEACVDVALAIMRSDPQRIFGWIHHSLAGADEAFPIIEELLSLPKVCNNHLVSLNCS